MKFSIPALTAADTIIAATPEIGAESIVKLSSEEFVKVLELEQTGALTTDFTTETTFGAGITVDAAGKDLHLRCENGGKADSGVDGLSVVLDVTFDDDTTGTITAEMFVSAWMANQEKVFPVGLAVDFQSAGDKKIKSIQGIDSVIGGIDGRINRFSVWASPAASTFLTAGATREKEGPYQLPTTVNIADRYDATRWTKKGRSEQQDLRLQFPWISEMEHVARYNGHRCTVLKSVIKDDQVPWSNVIYTGYRPNASPSRGDGDDEVLATSEGSYENFLCFYAA